MIIVRAADDFGWADDDTLTLNPRDPAHYDVLLSEAGISESETASLRILHLWSLWPDLTDLPDPADLEILERSQDLGFYSLLYLAQAVGRQDGLTAVRVFVITNNMQGVSGGDLRCPLSATLLGAVQIIPLEYRQIKMCSIDIDLRPPSVDDEPEAMDQLWAEFHSDVPQGQAAYRQGRRWLPSYEPVPLKKSTLPLSQAKVKGVYLIAGGFRCLEMNISANLGGLHLPFFKSFYLQNPLIGEFLKGHGITIIDQNLLSIFLRHAIQSAQVFLSGSAAEFNLAIAFPEYGSQADVDSLQAALDELFHQELIQMAKGIAGKVICCDLNQLKVAGDVLYYRRQKINILMEMYGGVVPPEMIRLFQDRRLCLFNGPISGLLSNKLNLALLSEQADSPLFSHGEKQAIRKYIPWTRKIVKGKTTYSGQTI